VPLRWAAQKLLQVGLSREDGEKYPHEFSGGQRPPVLDHVACHAVQEGRI
jgi:ABC-type oligopeptide transport system ATPase subunit